jgi:hypothetical protein
MRWASFAILGLLLSGCALETEPATVVPTQQVTVTYTPATSTALAFDPPVLAGTPRLDLSRNGREPAAFAGFNESTTEYYSLTTYDWYSDFAGNVGNGQFINPENYQRRAVTQSNGISHH